MAPIYGDRLVAVQTTQVGCNMIPTKAYILRINNPISIEYANVCAESCDKVGLPYEFFEGYMGLTEEELWPSIPIDMKIRHRMDPKAACATAGHFMIWKKILENKECAIILEHDAVMLHKVDIDIPDDLIVTLGYKLHAALRYDHTSAGPATQLVPIAHHGGAHAYAITWKTAESLLTELQEGGVREAIDNMYFMRDVIVSKTPIAIADPTPAIGWLRKSTIWGSSAEMNYSFLSSFVKNYK